MANPRLTAEQRESVFTPLFAAVLAEFENAAAGNPDLLWALRRKLTVKLTHEERGHPSVRARLKVKKLAEQGDKCALCQLPLALKGAELDRTYAPAGYTEENTRLVHHDCHVSEQKSKIFA